MSKHHKRDSQPHSILVPGLPPGKEFNNVKVCVPAGGKTGRGSYLILVLEDGSVHHNRGEYPKDLLLNSDFTDEQRRMVAKRMGLKYHEVQSMMEENIEWERANVRTEEVRRAMELLKKHGYVVKTDKHGHTIKPDMRGKWERGKRGVI